MLKTLIRTFNMIGQRRSCCPTGLLYQKVLETQHLCVHTASNRHIFQFPVSSCNINNVSKLCSPLMICDRKWSNQLSGPEKKPSLYQRFKTMYKEYWYILVPVHIVTSSFWFGGFYYLAVSGIDIVNLLEIVGAPDTWVTTMRESKAGGLVTAYTMYKIATPARYTVTLGGTTVSITYLKKWGWIKPMPSTKELHIMYEDKKSALKERMTNTKDEIKDEFIKTKDEIMKTRDNLTQHVMEAKTGLRKSVKDTRDELRQGVREAADEWSHVGKLVKQRLNESKADDNK